MAGGFGALVVATGVVIAWPFATPGALLILVCALGLAGHWSRRFGLKAVLMDGVAASLFASVVGLMVSVLAGFLHGAGVFADTTIAVCVGRRFFAALGDRGLESVVAGMALAGAGHSGARHHAAKLAASGGLRGALFLAAALALILGWDRLGSGLLLAGLALFVLGLAQAVRVQRSTR